MWNMGNEAIKKKFSILTKLDKAGAFSSGTAVSPEKAHLNWQEIEWLSYLAGGTERIQKTRDGLYYDSTQEKRK